VGTKPNRKIQALPPVANPWKLTSIEYFLGLWLASGMTNKELADKLSLSEKTTSTYVMRGRIKMNARTICEYACHIAKHAEANSVSPA
jgi:DNA-binding CsgD family transcriptional regulator